jgi:hypothetical protein
MKFDFPWKHKITKSNRIFVVDLWNYVIKRTYCPWLRYEILSSGQTELGEFVRPLHGSKTNIHSQSTIDLWLGHLVPTWGPPVWRHVATPLPPPSRNDILLSPWRQTGAGVRERESESEITCDEGRNVFHCGRTWLVHSGGFHQNLLWITIQNIVPVDDRSVLGKRR